jgi:fucose permease
MNSHGVRVETAYRRPVMASMHACYSLGGFAGALFGGAFAWAGIGPEPAFVAAGLPAAAVAAGAGRWLSGLPPAAPSAAALDAPDARPPSAAAPDARRPGAPAPPGPPGPPHRPSAQHPHELRPARPRRALTRTGWLVLALGILGLCGLVGEGAAGDWSAVYLHDNLGASAGLAAVGYGVFSVTMTAGRLVGDRLAARFGPVRLVRGCGLLATAGLAGGLLSHSIAGTLAGFAVLGAGLSCVVPQVFSAGGRADPIRPGRGLARVVGLGYLGLAGGPVVIGACAGLTGLRVALGIPVVLCVWVAVSARALAPRAPAPGPPAPGPGPRVPP